MSDKKDKLIGQTLGQYTILEEAGRGGMATVYSATQKSMNRTVAVKVLPPHFLHDPDFLERFEREVEVISGLEHPHILPIYDYGEAEGMPYIAMRFLGGGSMAQKIREGKANLADLIKPFNQICEALDYAHQQGIIHRDLKPGNIMLDEYGNAYLTDFGIARVMGSDLTGSAIIGTPAYMSPEQAHGVSIDARSDIYSLGIVLFEIITGTEPYQAETPMSLLLMHINEPMPPLSKHRDDIPDPVEDVIMKATEKNPDDRFSSAGEMAKAFAYAVTDNAPTKRVYDPERTITDNVKPLPKMGGTIIGGERTSIPSPDDVPTQQRVEPSPAGTTQAIETKQRNFDLTPILIGIVVVAVMIASALFFVNQGRDDNTVAALPTPFANSVQVTENNYAINIPQNLMPANISIQFDDQSDAQRQYHVWRSDNGGDVMVSVAVVDAARTPQSIYQTRYYEDDSLALIDEATAEDGTLRRSYRVVDDSDLDNGQLDVFYIERNGFLAVVEMYTADNVATDEQQIATLQAVLDSVRVLGDES